MFYKRPITSIAEHKAIYNWVAEALDVLGFPPEQSGLDKGCKSGNQSFYMPCTNRAYQEWHFFEKHWTKTKEIEKYAIDPDACVALNRQEIIDEAGGTVLQAKPDKERIEQCLAPLRVATDGKNAIGFEVTCRLIKMGLSDDQIERHLTEVIPRSNIYKKRISGWITSGRTYQGKWQY